MKTRLALLGVLLLGGVSAASADDAWTAQYAEQAGPLIDAVLESTPGTAADQHQNVRPTVRRAHQMVGVLSDVGLSSVRATNGGRRASRRRHFMPTQASGAAANLFLR